MINKKSYIVPNRLHLSFVILLLFVFFFVFFNYANEKPRGIHQWAQADRYSVAERYTDGRSLIDPATHNFKTTDGRVGVEFSGYQYLIAQVIRAGVNKHYLPFIYRFLTFFIFFISLFALVFKLLEKEKLLYRSAIFLGIICSPILLYYSYNFLPDIIALSLLLWCFYFMHVNFEKYIYVILLIAGLSFLIKTSSGVYFISFYAVYFLLRWRKWNSKFFLSSTLFLLIGLGVASYDYFLVSLRNQELNSYIFMSVILPVQSFDEFWGIFDTASRFLYEYFNGSQWFVFWVVVAFNLFHLKGKNLKNKYVQIMALLVLGLLAFLYLFGGQFRDHDYYVLCTFMPIILFIIIKTLANVSEYIHPRTALILASAFALVSFTQGSNRYFNRMSEVVHINGWPEPYERTWLIDSDKKIQRYVGINDLVIAVYVPEPNLSLVYLDRKGTCFNSEEMSRDDSPFTWFLKYLKAPYVVCNERYTEQFENDYPEFHSGATILFSDESLTLYKANGY